MKKGILLYFFLAILPLNLIFSQSLLSVDKYWDDGGNPDNEWTNANNWNENSLPSTIDDTFINNNYDANISSGNNIVIESLALGSDHEYTGSEPIDTMAVYHFNTSGHLTIASGATLTTEKGSHEGSDGVHLEGVSGNESTLTINGTLNVESNASGDGLDIKEYTSVVVGTNGNLNVTAKNKSGINTGDDITNSGTITITASSSCTDGIKFSGPVSGSKITNNSDASITISGGEFMRFGINLNGDFTFDNFGTVTVSGISTDTILEGGMTFNNYGTLAGDGIINAQNFIGGGSGSTITPGVTAGSIGKLTFNKPVNLSDNNINIEINGATTYDQIEAGLIGAINISNAILNLSGIYTPVAGDEFMIINNTSGNPITGTFFDLPEGETFDHNGIDLTISYTGGDGNDVSLTFDSPLPVELIDFSAKSMENEVRLIWATANETNNDFFTIERSENGHIFKELATVSGNGSSIDFHEYSFSDKDPIAGITYYRLKQTDFDGQYSYSEIEQVEFREEAPIKIYPTLVNEVIIIEAANSNNEITAFVSDLNGNILKSFNVPKNEYQKEILLSDLLPGNYFFTISKNNTLETFKFVKL